MSLATLLLVAILGLALPGRAAAVPLDLSVNACPGNPGASSNAGTLDCAGGQPFALLVSFAPVDPLPALTECRFELDATVDGDLSTNAAFWDFDNANHAAWHCDPSPAAGCNGYTGGFNAVGSFVLRGGLSHTGGSLRPLVDWTRPTPIAIAANQPVFVTQILIDVGTSIEAGGTEPGCARGVCFEIPGATLTQSAGAGPSPGTTAALDTPSNVVAVNGGAGSSCVSVAVRRRTWGQHKSLYR